MPSDLRHQDIDVFAQAVIEYFETTTGERAMVRSAWLLEQEEPVLRDDYNGLIEVSGGYSGSICFSAPARLLDYILLASGDQQYSEANYLDVVGEIANTFSGRARQHFGEALSIAPPRAFKRNGAPVLRRTDATPYAIPITWRTIEANLVVHLSAA
jgi:chemotaxis protein CheX